MQLYVFLQYHWHLVTQWSSGYNWRNIYTIWVVRTDKHNSLQMLHRLQHVCVTVRLQHGTHVIDESINKASMSKLYTHNWITMYFIALWEIFSKQNSSHTYSIWKTNMYKSHAHSCNVGLCHCFVRDSYIF